MCIRRSLEHNDACPTCRARIRKRQLTAHPLIDRLVNLFKIAHPDANPEATPSSPDRTQGGLKGGLKGGEGAGSQDEDEDEDNDEGTHNDADYDDYDDMASGGGYGGYNGLLSQAGSPGQIAHMMVSGWKGRPRREGGTRERECERETETSVCAVRARCVLCTHCVLDRSNRVCSACTVRVLHALRVG